jgi:hypothetical protein
MFSTNNAYNGETAIEAVHAINAIGTNGAPLLLKWLVAKDTPMFRFLGRHRTIPAANHLIELAERDNGRGWLGLTALGTNALPYLRKQLESPDPYIRADAAQVIQFIKTVPRQPPVWAGPD